MTWQEDKFEHAQVYLSALNKLVGYLGSEKLNDAQMYFYMENSKLLEKISPNSELENKMFLTWLISEYKINDIKAASWATTYKSFTKDEKDVLLLAATKYLLGLFLIKQVSSDSLIITDSWDKEYFIEVCNLEGLKENTCIMAQIRPKNNNKWFMPGIIGPHKDDAPFKHAQKIVSFDKQLNETALEFSKHLIEKENLSEKTAWKHFKNIELFTLYLREQEKITSFEQITKGMVKSRFKNFLRKTWNTPHHEDTLYSLHKFFSYLEKKGIKNEEAYNWLKNIA